jgi:hypothetical protein
VDGIVVVVIFGLPPELVPLLTQPDKVPSAIESSATVAIERKRFITPPEDSATELYRIRF